MAAADMLSPYCEACDEDVDIYKAVVGGANPDGTHDVHEYHLECGHVTEPETALDVGLVYMLSEAHPEYIDIDGDIDEQLLDEHLDNDRGDHGWRGYLYEGLGMLAAVYIVARDKLREVRRSEY